MDEALVAIVATFFLWMGAAALLRPARVLAIFGTEVTSRETRNEIRAVYGGYGIAVAGLLLWGLERPSLQQGIFTAIATSVLGMVAGRLWSMVVDRGAGFYPLVFLGTEIAIAGALLISHRPLAG